MTVNPPPTRNAIVNAVLVGIYLIAAPVTAILTESETPVWLGACLLVGLIMIVSAGFNAAARRQYDNTKTQAKGPTTHA